MAGLTGKYVSSSYQELVRISGSKLSDGTGSLINAITLGDVTVTGSLLLNNLSTAGQTNVLTYNPSNGQVYYTASAAIAPTSSNFPNGLTVTGSFISSGSITLNGPVVISHITSNTVSAAGNGLVIGITGSVAYLNSIAVGTYVQAGDGSGQNGCIAVGYRATASGQFCGAIGRDVVATGQGSFAAGYGATATFDRAVALNEGDASSRSSLAANASTATGDYSFATGRNTTATGDSGSFSAGFNTIATGDIQMAVGRYNDSNNTSSLFVVGGGSGNSFTGSIRRDIFDVRVDSNYSASISIPSNPQAPSNPVSGSMYWSGSFIFLYTGKGVNGWQSASLS